MIGVEVGVGSVVVSVEMRRFGLLLRVQRKPRCGYDGASSPVWDGDGDATMRSTGRYVCYDSTVFYH